MKLWQIVCLCVSLCLLLAAGCTTTKDTSSLMVSLAVDGQERSYPQPMAITVGEFLRQANVELGSLDEVTPPLFTQISDGMRITVTRVQETQECENQEIPFKENRIPNEGLKPGEERVAQAGQSGVEEICYRVTIRDGARQDARAHPHHRHHRAAGRRDLRRIRPGSLTRCRSRERSPTSATATPGSCAASAPTSAC